MQVLGPISKSPIDVSPLGYSLARDLPPQGPFEGWRDLVAEFVEHLSTSGRAGDFTTRSFSWNLGGMTFARTLLSGAAARRWRYRPQSFLDHWCVVLVRSVADDQVFLSLTSSSVDQPRFRPLAMPSKGRATETEVLALFLHRDQLEEETRHFDLIHDRDINPALAALLADYMSGLGAQLPHLSDQHAQALAPITRSFVAACVAPSAESTVNVEAPVASLLLNRAQHVVRRNMASPDFGPEQLCRLLAVSRSKLYRLFEKSGGIARFINGERLREAHRRLSDPLDMTSIHVVGSEVCFADHSTFSRAFKREFGYSPSEARERALAKLVVRPARPFARMQEAPSREARAATAAAGFPLRGRSGL